MLHLIKQGISNPRRTKDDYIFLNEENNLHRYRYSYFCKLLTSGMTQEKRVGKEGGGSTWTVPEWNKKSKLEDLTK